MKKNKNIFMASVLLLSLGLASCTQMKMWKSAFFAMPFSGRLFSCLR